MYSTESYLKHFTMRHFCQKMFSSALPVKLGFDPSKKYLKLCQSHRGHDWL